MNEDLRALRTVHSLLMLVCGAILIFALTPDMRATIDQARQEVIALSEININEYASFISARFRQQREANLAILRRALIVNGIRAEDIDFHQPIWDNMPALTGGGLKDFEAFFNSAHVIRTMRFDPRSRKTLEAEIKARVLPLQPGQAVRSVVLYLTGTSYAQFGDTWVLPSVVRPGDTSVRFDFLVSPGFGESLQRKSVDFYYDLSDPETGPFAMDWLATTPQGSIVMRRDVFCPGLKAFWADVSLMTANDALRYIQARDEAARDKLSFFGLAVDRRGAVWISPAVTALMLLLLIAHLRQARPGARHSGVVPLYPWVGAFGDWVGAVVAYTSIGIVPVVVNVYLIVRSRESDSAEGRAAAMLTLLALAASVWGSLELYRLRSAIWHQAPGHSTDSLEPRD